MGEETKPKELTNEEKLVNSLRFLDISIFIVGKEPLTSETAEAISQTHSFLKQIRANAQAELELIKNSVNKPKEVVKQ